MFAKNLLIIFALVVCFSNNANADFNLSYTNNISIVNHKLNDQDKTSYGKFFNRFDGLYMLLNWAGAGLFFEYMALGKGLTAAGTTADTRTSWGFLANAQFGHWLVNMLFGFTSEAQESGITSQLEVAYLFPISDSLFIGPKLSLRRYSLDTLNQNFIEPTVHLTYWL